MLARTHGHLYFLVWDHSVSSATKQSVRGRKARHFLNKYVGNNLQTSACVIDLSLEQQRKAGKLCRAPPLATHVLLECYESDSRQWFTVSFYEYLLFCHVRILILPTSYELYARWYIHVNPCLRAWLSPPKFLSREKSWVRLTPLQS